MESKIVVDKMLNNDAFSQWLGLKVISCKPGKVDIEMTVREEMTNGFKIAHGGITFSMADSALAFSSNSHGKHAVSIETSIAHLAPVKSNDVLTTNVKEINRSSKLGRYAIAITNQNDALVAQFNGTVFFKDTLWSE